MTAEERALLSLILNKQITHEQILGIDLGEPLNVTWTVLEEVKNLILEKKYYDDILLTRVLVGRDIGPDNASIENFLKKWAREKANPKMLDTYVKIIMERSFKHSLVKQVEELNLNIDKMGYENILSELNKLADMRPFESSQSLDVVIRENTEEILSGSDIIKFGGFIGESIGGFTLGEMSVWGGRPGANKTNTAINLIEYMATNHPDKKVLVISREMATNQVIERQLLLNAGGKLLYEDMRTGERLEGDKRRIAIETLKRMEEKYKNIIIDDSAQTVDEGVALILKYRPDLVVDDFIQLVVDEKYSEDKVRFLIAKILKTYKWLSKKMKCHIMNFSQLNREIENRVDGIPQMSDFYESSLIEILAELCVIMKPADEDSTYKGKLLYYILKARHGKVGTRAVKFEPAWCKINLEDE